MNALAYYLVRRSLNRANRKHLAEFPQVACYSFDLITTYIHLEGQYERELLELLVKDVFPKLPKESVCLDVGANIGNHSLSFSNHFKRVISFEPHPRNFALLAVNATNSDRITPLMVGASSRTGQVKITEEKTNLAASSIENSEGRDGNLVQFDLVRIDDVPSVKDSEQISFVKFDIEGHEAEAIKGASETIGRHKPLIMLEVLAGEIEGGTSPSIEALRELGYQYFFEPVEAGWLGTAPKPLKKALRAFYSVFTLKRPKKAERLVPLDALENRNYSMVLCSVEMPSWASQ